MPGPQWDSSGLHPGCSTAHLVLGGEEERRQRVLATWMTSYGQPIRTATDGPARGRDHRAHGSDLGEQSHELATESGTPYHAPIDAPATPEQRQALSSFGLWPSRNQNWPANDHRQVYGCSRNSYSIGGFKVVEEVAVALPVGPARKTSHKDLRREL